jgi:hypothetical protein
MMIWSGANNILEIPEEKAIRLRQIAFDDVYDRMDEVAMMHRMT